MPKKPPILLIAGVLGVLALGGTALLMMRGSSSAPPAAPAGTEVALAAQPTPVPEMRYIANRDIPPRTVMTSDMLRRAAISGPIPPGAITSLDDVRGMITSKPIRSGDTISSDSFIEQLDRVIPARFTIPSGFRAVAVYVDPKQTAAGLVDVGDRVDVLVTQKLAIDKEPNQVVIGAKEFTAGRTIGTNLLVLAVEESLASPLPTPPPALGPDGKPVAPADGAPADGPAPLPDGASPPPAGGTAPVDGRSTPDAKPEGNIRVILAAPLETASRLVAANDSGTIHIVVRNPLDGDAERAPETREYPSRTINVAQPKTGGGGGGGGNGGGGSNRAPSFPVPDLPDVTVSQTAPALPPMPMPIQASAPTGGMGMTAPAPVADAGPPMRDVMVVRGTEKTRVIVPKR